MYIFQDCVSRMQKVENALKNVPYLCAFMSRSVFLAFFIAATVNSCISQCFVPSQMEERRDSMLETAKLCFTSASRCEGDGDEEEWLIHYMLGKIAEKQKQPPVVYLLHYKQAGHYLHEEAARYPKKIHYHNPPELAMEALEVKEESIIPRLESSVLYKVPLVYIMKHAERKWCPASGNIYKTNLENEVKPVIQAIPVLKTAYMCSLNIGQFSLCCTQCISQVLSKSK